LLQMARARGIQTITGLEMFVNQGAEQFQLWTGKPAPKEEMYRVALHALKQRAEAAGQDAPKAAPAKAVAAKAGAVTEKRVPRKTAKRAAKAVHK
jgi:3-dehydroquinate dehydratase/shikimate dehydrogenase